jgi:phosphopantetheinyl transferase
MMLVLRAVNIDARLSGQEPFDASAEDIAYSVRFKRPERRRQALAARTLARLAAAGAWEIDAKDFQFEQQPTGQWIMLAKSGERLSVSMSHSRHLVAAAISKSGRIGVDIEHHVARRDLKGIGAALGFMPDLDDAAFYRIWTMREAYFKAAGSMPTDAGLESIQYGVRCSGGRMTSLCLRQPDCLLAARNIDHQTTAGVALVIRNNTSTAGEGVEAYYGALLDQALRSITARSFAAAGAARL